MLTKLSASCGYGRSLHNFWHKDRLVGLSTLERYSVVESVRRALKVLRWGFTAIGC